MLTDTEIEEVAAIIRAKVGSGEWSCFRDGEHIATNTPLTKLVNEEMKLLMGYSNASGAQKLALKVRLTEIRQKILNLSKKNGLQIGPIKSITSSGGTQSAAPKTSSSVGGGSTDCLAQFKRSV